MGPASIEDMHAFRRFLLPILLATTLSIATTSTASAATVSPAFRLVPVAGASFDSPVWVGGAPGGSAPLYVVEQRGVVWKLVDGKRSIFLDLRRTVQAGGEQGLLSLAFARDYRTSGRFFVYFVAKNGNGEVRQFRAMGGKVVSGSGRTVIRVSLAPSATNHNGGNLQAGPSGLLYLSIGDGGGAGDPTGNAQRLDRLQGTIIRITPRLGGGYTIPRSNPYYGRAGARREIFALGLRNPWRWSIDTATGDMWIGDVGQGEREEIDRLVDGRPLGANFGWPRMEGTQTYSASTMLTSGTPYVAPFLDYGRGGGECSVTGGVVYRGPVTALRGWYLYADFCTSTITAVNPASKRRVVRAGTAGIVHFGVGGAAGNVYVASQQTGRIHRIASPA